MKQLTSNIFLLIALTFIIYFQTFAEGTKIDSLLNELSALGGFASGGKTAKEACPDLPGDTNKVKILNKLAWELRSNDPEKALQYGKQALLLAQKHSFKKGIANSYNKIGIVYKNQGNYELAVNYYKKSLKINKELGNNKGIAMSMGNMGEVYRIQCNYEKAMDFCQQSLKINKELEYKQGIAISLNNMGNIYYNQCNYEKAMGYYLQSLKINKKIKEKQGIALSLSNIGNTYHYQGNYKQAIDYYLQSLKICEELGDKKGIAWNLGDIGAVFVTQDNYEKAFDYYQQSLKIEKEIKNKQGIALTLNSIGAIYFYQNNYKKAIDYYLQSLKINEELKNKLGIATILNNIGNIYHYQNKTEQAIGYYLQSLKIKEELGNKIGIVVSLNNIGSIYFNKNNYKQAEKYFQKSLTIAKEIGSKNSIRRAYKNLSETHSIQNQYKKALEYYKLYTEVKDSLFNEESNKQITEMQTKYETEKKEKEIALLNKEKQLQKTELAQKQAEIKKKNIQRNAFIGGFVLVLALVFVVYRGYSQKKKSNQILSEKNILITQQKAELTQTLEELRATQEQLVESEKMASLGNLVAGVAHEINTPVGIGITASSSLVEDTKQFAELYKKDKMSRKVLEEYLENTFQASKLILKNMNRTGELVQSFKQVSVDQMVDEKRKFNLKSYVNDILLSIKPEFAEKTIKLSIDCEEKLEINSFPGAFAQIITNLTLNSIRHGFREKDKGEIKISIRRDEASLVSTEANNLIIQYTDNGCGISKENLPKIFDPFFTTNKQIGTGLGLNIVYNLVTQKLKGTVNCESESGNGVLFTIDIPLMSYG